MAFLDNTGLSYFWSKLKALFATKSELEVVRQSASKAYHYKGSVATVSALPANAEQGDVYNVGTTLDGDNYAWTGTAWDKLGASVDLSPYALDADVVKLSGDQTVGGTKTFSTGPVVSTTAALKRSVNNSYLNIYGGTAYGNGAFISLHGKDDTDAGYFVARASDGTNNKELIGKPDGTLTWTSKDIALDENVIHKTGDETVGGTKTFSGDMVFSQDQSIIRTNGNAKRIQIGGGSDGTTATGAVLIACGINSGTGNAGRFKLIASNGTTNKYLTGDPSGTLTWDSKDIITNGGDQTVGGTKTFSTGIVIATNAAIKRDVDNSNLTVYGCSGYGKGAYLSLNGKDSSNAGFFTIRASDGTSNKDFRGQPDGTLTWNGQSIQTTSDERLKTPLADVPDAVLDAWGDVGWGQFQYLDAVEAKGVDKARLHLGLIAQRVKAVFEARGLDACAYGILCHEEYPAMDDEPAVDIWMVRYTEAAAMEAAYQRRRADRAEARLASIEERLAALEAKMA